jgi:hypothetical protein
MYELYRAPQKQNNAKLNARLMLRKSDMKGINRSSPYSDLRKNTGEWVGMPLLKENSFPQQEGRSFDRRGEKG